MKSGCAGERTMWTLQIIKRMEFNATATLNSGTNFVRCAVNNASKLRSVWQTIKTELYSYGISILILCEWYFFHFKSVSPMRDRRSALCNEIMNLCVCAFYDGLKWRKTKRGKKPNSQQLFFLLSSESIRFHLMKNVQ